MLLNARSVLETCLYVDDLGAAERFYTDVLGLEKYAAVEGRHLFYRCGDAMFLLFNAKATAAPGGIGLPAHGATGSGHVAFRMLPEEEAGWRAQLEEHGVAIEYEYTWPSGGRSLYFRDPAGNSLEFATASTWKLPD